MAMQIHMFGGSGRLTPMGGTAPYTSNSSTMYIDEMEKEVFLCPSEKTGNIGHGAGELWLELKLSVVGQRNKKIIISLISTKWHYQWKQAL